MDLARRFGPGPQDDAIDDLARRFLAGDAIAVARVEGLIARIVRFRGYYIPREDRRDVVQQTMLDLCQALARPGLAFTTGFCAFIRSVACRRCVDWMRQHRTHEPIDPAVPDSLPGPDRELLDDEERRLVLEVLGELPGPCRELFELHAGSELTYREIAERQGRSQGALRTQMWECLKEARETLRRKQQEKRPPRSRERAGS